MAEKKSIKVVMCKPGENAKAFEITNLDFYINPKNRCEYDLKDAVLLFDKTAGVKDEPMNRFVELEDGTCDVIAGFMIICGKDKDGNYVSIDPEAGNKYANKYHNPHMFMFIDDRLLVFAKRKETEMYLVTSIITANHDDEKHEDAVLLDEVESNAGSNES